ncbi:MAG: MBL fold metallo-hydrolase [Bacteroidota bacterium]|nr:MBL fold metallo-hydrolase [Bacteroidota bacterium]
MKLYTIETEFFKLDGGAMFGVVPKVIWNKMNPADENNLCTWAMRCLLIEVDNKVILIDNGIGNKQDEKFMSHYHLDTTHNLDKSLTAAGFTKEDITDVILTHLHFDHCGGSIEIVNNQLVPAFKNATYWSNEAHWKWATEPNAREKASFLKENILPIQESGQLRFVERENNIPDNRLEYVTSSIHPSISFRFANGHTNAMMLPQISYNGRTIVYMADLLPSIHHIPMPYVMGYDMFPLTTMQEKHIFLNEALQNDYILYFEHDPVNECCNLQQTNKGIRHKDCFTISEIVN